MPYYYKTYYNHRIQQTLDDEMSRVGRKYLASQEYKQK